MLVARLEVMGEIDARGAIRFRVDSATTLRGMDGKPFDVTVENFSRTGFLFVADVDLPVGTLVSVGLSGAGVREAKVVRRDGERHGCEFLMPLPQRELAHAFKGQAEVLAELEALLRRAREGRG
ncbi:MAG: PilZ domain-containing protein [Sphingomonas sp.]